MGTLDWDVARSPMRDRSPAVKTLFVLGSLLLCVGVGNRLFCLGMLVWMSAVGIYAAGGRWVRFLKLIGLPIGFLLIGSLTIAAECTLWPFSLTFPTDKLVYAGALLLRASACVCCICVLCLSTSIGQLLGLLERLHLPKLLLELCFLTYRFVGLLLGMSAQAFDAQRARMGGGNLRARLRSMGILCGNLFARVLGRSTVMLLAMESRGYDGGIGPQPIRQQASRREWLWLVGYLVPVGALAFVSRLMEV